jgi:hypothetical protein
MENSNTGEVNPNDLIGKFKDQTPLAFLIDDIESSSRLQKEDGKFLLLSLSKVLNKHYIKKERDAMVKFAFDFYADLSRKMKVPENLISENLTHAEIYFDGKFNKKI